MILAEFQAAVLALARKLFDGQPLPSDSDRFWRRYTSISQVDRTAVFSAAQDLVELPGVIRDAGIDTILKSLVGASYSDGLLEGYGPMATIQGTVWSRVGVPVKDEIVWRSIKTEFDWGGTKGDMFAAIRAKMIDTLKKYLPEGTYDPDDFIYAEVISY